METEELSIDKAIKAINDGKRVIHICLNGKSLGKWKHQETIHDVVHGWDNIKDPLHIGTTYYKEFISPVELFNGENESLGFGGVTCAWVNDPDKRGIPADGWILLGEKT